MLGSDVFGHSKLRTICLSWMTKIIYADNIRIRGIPVEFGFVRETEELARKEGIDVETGVSRTGLDTYLKYIFPNINDWIHDKTFPGMRTRPDYRNDTFKLVVEFDGLPHFQSKTNVDKDFEKTRKYADAGYTVVRIPLYINLTTDVINNLFNTNLQQSFFTANVSLFNANFQPNCFCMAGLKRMAEDYLNIAPEQIPRMMKSIKDKSPDEYEFLKKQGCKG